MVTWENYEEYMIMHADGELDPGEEQALRAFISEHKELEAEMAIYEQVRLVPDTTEVFANKELLLKQAPGGRVIGLTPWKTYAVAAGILALICLAGMKWLTQPAVDSQQLAVGSSRPTVGSQQPAVGSGQPTVGSQQVVATTLVRPENKPTKHIKNTKTAVL